MAERSEPEQRLREVVKGFDTAMLVTHAGAGGLRARPMAVAELAADDVVYFATAIDSAKVTDLRANPKAHVIFQGGNRYAFLSGSVEILKDRALVERLWSEAWRLWFTKGKDDPTLCILAFDVDEGEYWDEGGANAVKFLFKAAKAYVTGTQPTADQSEHGKVRL